jgi:hypothetical protein
VPARRPRAGGSGAAGTLMDGCRVTMPRGHWTSTEVERGCRMGSVIKKRRKRMAKKKHRKLLKKTRVQRRRQGK